jgi:hypothetical protein
MQLLWVGFEQFIHHNIQWGPFSRCDHSVFVAWMVVVAFISRVKGPLGA